jgi:maltokinase
MSDGLAAWLPAQRWFRSKQRHIASVTERDRASLGAAALVVVEVAYVDGAAPDRYLLPTVEGREPNDGEGVWAGLVDAMATGASLNGVSGRFVGRPWPALAGLLAGDLTERRLRVEQTNTSAVVGDRMIVKLYRLLEVGENPDIEISAFLADAGFADTPALAGTLTYEADGGLAAAAMLQAFVPSVGDGWASMLDALAADPMRGMQLAARIGEVTARMHAALASRPEHPAFPFRAATVAETGAWRAAAEAQLALAVSAASGEAHDRMVAAAPAVRARFADTFGAATGATQVSRIHGDYHLGQLLARRDGGFSVIDFEGEPARPLSERRAPSSPLRDLAGMLRSIDYAARTAERGSSTFDAAGWLPEARAAFLDAAGVMGTDETRLLDAFELEKACYEVRYEASNRPDWVWLPLAALERMSATP